MSIRTFTRAGFQLVFIVVVAVVGAFAAGASVAAAQSDEVCTYFELPYEQSRPVVVDADDPQCPVDDEVAAADCAYAELPYEQARPVVVSENDPHCPTNIAVQEASEEAAAWPDFDPSDMSREVAATKAGDEAATWPNFDSTSISTDTTAGAIANSPRMTQIGAATS